MICGIIFDLGGTLIRVDDPDLDAGNARALLVWLRRRGFAIPDGFAEAVRAERQALLASRTGLKEVTADQALRTVLERHGLPTGGEFVADAERAFFSYELERMQPLPGAVELLAGLNRLGLRTGLISNASSHYLVVECCRRLLFASYLEPIVSSAAFGWSKPDPRIFRAVLRRWDLPPEEAAMVGDTLAADTAGARAAGMRSILLTAVHPPGAPEGLPSVRPDAVARTLREAGEIIARWRESS